MGNLPKSFTLPTGVPIVLKQTVRVLFLVESLIKFLINEISGLHVSFGERDRFQIFMFPHTINCVT